MELSNIITIDKHSITVTNAVRKEQHLVLFQIEYNIVMTMCTLAIL